MKPTISNYRYALLWALFILFATIANTSTLESLSLKSLFAFDKPIHALLFGIQAWLLLKARLKTPFVSVTKIIVFACIASAAFGILTEVLQGWITTSRTFDFYDMLADILGCIIVGAWFWQKRKRLTQQV
jgi:VanZ family protein